jgi:hypothetical protein
VVVIIERTATNPVASASRSAGRPSSDDDLRKPHGLGTPILVSSDNFRGRIGDSRKDRRLDPWIGKKACYSTRANAIGGLGDGSDYQVRSANVDPGRMDIRRPRDGSRVAQQSRSSTDGEALPRPRRYVRWGFGSSKHRNCRNRGAPSAEHLGARWRLGMRMEVGVYCGTRHVMLSVFIRYGKDRLGIVARRTYKRADNLGRHLVVNCDGVREVFLADEMERHGRTARIDVVPPKRRKSVGVILSGIPVITNAKQPPLQEPDDGGRHDTCAEWILAVSSDVARNLKA